MNLRHIHTKDRSQCSAIEDITILAKRPNGWMTSDESKECQDFCGTEDEAVDLRDGLERTCTDRLAWWKLRYG